MLYELTNIVNVDNIDMPLSTLIIAPECKVVAGNAENKQFNAEIREKLDFFDQITCDDDNWEKNKDWENMLSLINKRM